MTRLRDRNVGTGRNAGKISKRNTAKNIGKKGPKRKTGRSTDQKQRIQELMEATLRRSMFSTQHPSTGFVAVEGKQTKTTNRDIGLNIPIATLNPGNKVVVEIGMDEEAVAGPKAMDKLDSFIKETIRTNPRMKEVHDLEIFKMDVANNFKRMRTEQNLTQKDLATLAGITQPMVARIENPSSKKSPTMATVSKVAGALGCKVRILISQDAF